MSYSSILLTCGIHRAHEKFAHAVEAKIKVTPFFKYFFLIKKYRFIEVFFPIIAFVYSLFIYVKEDVVLVEGSGMLHIAACLKFKQPRLKIIYLDADTFFYEMYTHKKHPKIFKYNLNTIDGIISVSEKNKYYARQYVCTPIVVAPPAAKKIPKANVDRKNYGLYVGRFDPEKNIPKILAFAIQSPHLEKFFVIGSGVYKEHVENLSTQNSKIVYAGIIQDNHLLSQYYYSCKFFINFSEYDSYPCTVLEATMAGCFPLLPRHIGNSHLFDEMFIFENINDYEDINKKIQYILAHENEARCSLQKSSDNILTEDDSLKNFQEKFKELLFKIEK